MEFLETVRCLIQLEGSILLLQKSSDSKFPLGFELPGGKSDIAGQMTESEMIELIIKEVKEETGIDLISQNIKKSDFVHHYNFEINGQSRSRKVYYFYAQIQQDPEINLNNLEDEDHHESYLWIEKSNLTNFLNENKVSPNSLEFLKLFSSY